MKRKLLIIDTETGGLDPARCALVSLAAVVYHDGAVEEAKQWIVLDGGDLDDSAMAIHGITRERIAAEGLSPWLVSQHVLAMLAKHDMRGRVVLAGHNLPFDVGFLRRLWEKAGLDYGAQFAYGGLDTKVAALLLEQAGKLDIVSSSLVDVAAKLGIKPWREHDALADALATAQVLRRLVDRISR